MTVLVSYVLANVKYKPIKIGTAEDVNAIIIFLIEEGETNKTYELEISDKETLEEFIDRTTNLQAKRIPNGGGDFDRYFYIRVNYKKEYNGERLLYCMINGEEILLSEGGHEAYKMSKEDSDRYMSYILGLCDESKNCNERNNDMRHN